MEIKKKENFKVEITFNMKCQYNYIYIIYIYKLNINDHKTVSNEKDMNNLFN